MPPTKYHYLLYIWLFKPRGQHKSWSNNTKRFLWSTWPASTKVSLAWRKLSGAQLFFWQHLSKEACNFSWLLWILTPNGGQQNITLFPQYSLVTATSHRPSLASKVHFWVRSNADRPDATRIGLYFLASSDLLCCCWGSNSSSIQCVCPSTPLLASHYQLVNTPLIWWDCKTNY